VFLSRHHAHNTPPVAQRRGLRATKPCESTRASLRRLALHTGQPYASIRHPLPAYVHSQHLPLARTETGTCVSAARPVLVSVAVVIVGPWPGRDHPRQADARDKHFASSTHVRWDGRWKRTHKGLSERCWYRQAWRRCFFLGGAYQKRKVGTFATDCRCGGNVVLALR
jgi:hypothetical protein